MIVAYIDGHRDRFGVEPICRVLSEHGMKIAPSTYYAALKVRVSPAALADAYHVNALVDLFRTNRRVYGVRKLWHTAGRAGLDLGRDQVARLMRIAGIGGIVRGEHTTTTTQPSASSGIPRQPDLIDRAWSAPHGQISGGWPTSPTSGHWPGSATPRCSPTCTRVGSSAGG